MFINPLTEFKTKHNLSWNDLVNLTGLPLNSLRTMGRYDLSQLANMRLITAYQINKTLDIDIYDYVTDMLDRAN